MKILFLGSNYWPDETGNAMFVTGRCEYLASRGHNVTICTGFPYYPEWRPREEYRGRYFMREKHNGVEIVRSPLYVPQRITSMGRILHEISFIASSLVTAMWQEKPDLLYIVSAPLGLAVSAYLLSHRWRIPYVFYVADMQPDTAAHLNMLPAPVMRFLYALESFAYRNAALIPTLTEGMRQKIISKGIAPEKVVIFSHCANQPLFDIPAHRGGQSFRRTHNLEGQFIVLHSGNIGVKQGLEVVVEAAARTRQNSAITYVLVGDGAARPVLQQRTAELGLSNVRFLPIQPKEVFWDMLGAADVCVITEKSSVGDILFPGKTVDFLSAGRAVIASISVTNEAARIVSGVGAGLVVTPEDPDAFAAAVTYLKDNETERMKMGERGRAYAREHWDRHRILPVMESTLAALVRGGDLRQQAA
ncbi:MAG: glycosyltransferase family 4 protein [Candidatus Binatus sp.]|uniref:glycosyltransferase family 4 protein n=1 Tax=Candidatus Binatus sp. TaxID=2811406 RepID=UPI00271E1C0F|nr:glycosyltransferase family 4 protein [Candidatus Binatus sp.]MDO8432781.1 glycosyltransferase family 4 protein [Candidatus Binatus sp.]